MKKWAYRLSGWWRALKTSGRFHNMLVFLGFVAVAALFWLMMALNDSVTRNIEVSLHVTGVPDTVTFIQDPPADFHVVVRDKGTQLMRHGGLHRAHVNLNFRDYAYDGLFRVSEADMTAALKNAFGSSAVISASSLDSLHLEYTAHKGKRVPVVVCCDVNAASGFIISDMPIPNPRNVLVYSNRDILDTLSRVYTKCILKRHLDATAEVEVGFKPIAGAKIEPSTIKVKIPVDPLVKKEALATVKALGVPAGKGMIFFPNKVPVSYYVPMGFFSEEEVPFEVVVNYNDIFSTPNDRVGLHLGAVPDYIEKVTLKADSVEYSLINK